MAVLAFLLILKLNTAMEVPGDLDGLSEEDQVEFYRSAHEAALAHRARLIAAGEMPEPEREAV